MDFMTKSRITIDTFEGKIRVQPDSKKRLKIHKKAGVQTECKLAVVMCFHIGKLKYEY